MASQFQNRLVGISILVASVVIFLPSIIDGKKTAYEDEFIATPLNPAIKPHTQNKPDTKQVATQLESDEIRGGEVAAQEDKWQVEEVAETVTLEPKDSTVAESVKITAAAVIPVVSKIPLPETAWTIQLGAFQNAGNINALLKTLHKAGFQAHTIPTDVIDGKLTRLFVGPDVSKSKLEQQLPRLKRLTNLEGKLLPFDAVNP